MGGYAIGVNQAESDRARQFARKDQLTDEQHADQRGKYIAAGKAYQVQLSSYKNDKGEVIPEYADQYKKVSDLSTQNEYNLGQLYDPIKAPGRLQADWHYLRERIHGIKQPTPTPTQAPAFTIPAPSPAPITTPELPAYQQTEFRMPSQGGNVTTDVPGVPSTTIQPMTTPVPDLSSGMQRRPPAAYVPAGSKVTVVKAPLAWKDRGTYQSPGELKQIAAARQKAQSDAHMLEAGAPMSPEQTAEAQARGQAALRWGNLRADLAQWDKDNANASKDDRDAVASQLYEKYIGTTGKGHWETVTGTIPDPTDPNKRIPATFFHDTVGNRLANSNGTPLDPEIASGFVPNPKSQSTDANKRADYQAYLIKNPDYEQKGGTFEKWMAEQTASGKGISWYAPTGQIAGGPSGRKYNAWDPDLPQDVKDMFKSQGVLMAKKQQDALALAAARGQSFAQNKIVVAQDKDDPASNVYIPAGLAYKLGFKAPSGAYYQAMEAMLKDATSGPIANEFTAFGTALQHADLLQKAALGLSNGDARLVNSITNDFSVAFGDPAVTNFDVIRGAYQRELTKALTTGHITDSEIAQNGLALPDNASHAQILGALNAYRALMNSKIAVRIPQIQSALSKFGISTPFTPPGYVPPGGGGSGAGKFPVKIPGTNKTKYFPTQAAADNFKKEANIP